MIQYIATEISRLYKSFRRGDERAFEELYSRLSGGLFNYCGRLLGDWHYAEDVVVETFTKLANSKLDERGNIKAWLYRVATNACYTFFRKKKAEFKYFEQQVGSIIGNPGPDFVKEVRMQKLLTKILTQSSGLLIRLIALA